MIIRKHMTDVLVWGIFCALLIVCFTGANVIKQYSSISLRYSSPISGRDAYAARQYSVARNDQITFWPTFWREYKASFSATFVTVEANCIAFSGDASKVLPVKFITGSAPGILDSNGCAVSEALAWLLWGSTDVVGMDVEVGGEVRVVRGVFEGYGELALVPYSDEDTAGSWSAVELSGGPDNVVRKDAESFAVTSGLGMPDQTLMGGEVPLAIAIAVLPLLIPAIYGLWSFVQYIRKRYPIVKKLIPFLILFAFATLLPIILGVLPEWIIPTRWSDFSFWRDLFKQAAKSLRVFLSISPQTRDVELRMLLINHACVTLLSACAGFAVIKQNKPRSRTTGFY